MTTDKLQWICLGGLLVWNLVLSIRLWIYRRDLSVGRHSLRRLLMQAGVTVSPEQMKNWWERQDLSDPRLPRTLRNMAMWVLIFTTILVIGLLLVRYA